KWQDSVVQVTYPIPKGGNAQLNEFCQMPNATDQLGFASGFIIHESGYLFTAAHALNGLPMSVMLSDGKNYPADVVGFDRALDLAVLKITPTRPLKAV